MRFIYETEEKDNVLKFKDVEEDQFFVDCDGSLCQKLTGYSYNQIADSEGRPLSLTLRDINKEAKIKRILPKVLKIEF